MVPSSDARASNATMRPHRPRTTRKAARLMIASRTVISSQGVMQRDYPDAGSARTLMAMDVLAIAGLAALVLVKEIGVPLPVPGDLLIIGAGATLAGDLPGAGAVLALILLAGFIGSSVQFFLIS